MRRLDNRQSNAAVHAPKEELKERLPSNAGSRRAVFTPREIQAYTELGLILKRIRTRVITEHGLEYFMRIKNEHRKNTTQEDQGEIVRE